MMVTVVPEELAYWQTGGTWDDFTGVLLSSSALSVAEVAASMRSSHLLPYTAESALEGSAEKAFRS